MGVAAYNRGTKLVREQIARDFDELPKRHPAEVSLYHAERINENLKAKVESLQQDLDRAKQYLELARLERDALKAEIAETGKWVNTLKGIVHAANERADKFKRSWIKASNLLRLLPKDLVDEVRDRGEHR
jgi:chromosome segregation ATPase